MPISLPNTVWLKLVADESTPDHLEEYAGTRLLLGPTEASTFPAPGVHDSFNVFGIDIYGFVRPAQSGDGYEWVMQSTPEPLVLAIQGLPGPQGWTNEQAGAVYISLGRELMRGGYSLGEVVHALTQLYNAARADV